MFYIALGNTAAKTIKMMKKVYPEDYSRRNGIFRWHKTGGPEGSHRRSPRQPASNEFQRRQYEKYERILEDRSSNECSFSSTDIGQQYYSLDFEE